MYGYFPRNFTVGENLRLTRQLFPLLFQFVLIFCDLTIDAPATLTPEELEDKRKQDAYLDDYSKKQEMLLGDLDKLLVQEAPISKENLSAMYDKIIEVENTDLQQLFVFKEKRMSHT